LVFFFSVLLSVLMWKDFVADAVAAEAVEAVEAVEVAVP
jgi:hypothetical protein